MTDFSSAIVILFKYLLLEYDSEVLFYNTDASLTLCTVIQSSSVERK